MSAVVAELADADPEGEQASALVALRERIRATLVPHPPTLEGFAFISLAEARVLLAWLEDIK